MNKITAASSKLKVGNSVSLPKCELRNVIKVLKSSSGYDKSIVVFQ